MKKLKELKRFTTLKLKKYVPYGILVIFSIIIFTTIIIFNKNSFEENYYLVFPILLLGYTTDKIIEMIEKDIDLENNNFLNPYICLIIGIVAFFVCCFIKYIVFYLFFIVIYFGCIFSIIWFLVDYSLKKMRHHVIKNLNNV